MEAHDVRPQRRLAGVRQEEGPHQPGPIDLEDEKGQGRHDDERGNSPVAPPLVGRGRRDHRSREQQRGGDAEQGRVEDVAAFPREQILRPDGQEDRKEQKEVVMRVVEDDRQGEPGDVGAEWDQQSPLPKEPVERHVEAARGRDGDQDLLRIAVETEPERADDRIERQQHRERNPRIAEAGNPAPQAGSWRRAERCRTRPRDCRAHQTSAISKPDRFRVRSMSGSALPRAATT